MNIPKCAVKDCGNNAFVLYGDKWVCGDCMNKIINKQNEAKQRELEELNGN